MWDKEFVWFVPNDDNRLIDGFDLRVEFLHENGVHDGLQDLVEDMGPCSFLEILIVLSRQLAFETGDDAPGWAIQLLRNLELFKMTDPVGRVRAEQVDQIMERVIWRRYDADGCGGFFPLGHPLQNQREVELWYQLNAYVLEIHPEY